MGISFGNGVNPEKEMMELFTRSVRLSPERRKQLLRLIEAYSVNDVKVV